MKKRIIINGSQGKMGSLALETLKKQPGFEIVGALGRHDDLGQCIENTHPDVVLDLTNADSVYKNTRLIIEKNVHPVIGTSGLQPRQIQEFNALCEQKQLGGIVVPNFSIGAVLMMHFAEIAAGFLPEAEIVETHHQQKLDAPSGTALKTAELMVKARKTAKNILDEKELLAGARGGRYEDIHIHSIRLPGVLARQEVIFGSLGETLSIQHDSIDRDCFMPGVVLACEKVAKLNKLYYGLAYLLLENG